MWILRLIDCLIHGHTITEMVCQTVGQRNHYYYCLHCGKVHPVNNEIHSIQRMDITK